MKRNSFSILAARILMTSAFVVSSVVFHQVCAQDKPGSVGTSWNKQGGNTGQKGDQRTWNQRQPQSRKQTAIQKSWDSTSGKNPTSWKNKKPESEVRVQKPQNPSLYKSNAILLDSLEQQQCLSPSYLKGLRARNEAARSADQQKSVKQTDGLEVLHHEILELLDRCLGRIDGPRHH
jgi:hypothetical protein